MSAVGPRPSSAAALSASDPLLQTAAKIRFSNGNINKRRRDSSRLRLFIDRNSFGRSPPLVRPSPPSLGNVQGKSPIAGKKNRETRPENLSKHGLNSICSLKICICNLKMKICRLKMDICRLQMELSSCFERFSKAGWEVFVAGLRSFFQTFHSFRHNSIHPLSGSSPLIYNLARTSLCPSHVISPQYRSKHSIPVGS